MSYVVLIHATFDSQADADHIYDQAKAVAVNASVARIGEAGERTSHCGVYNEQAGGSLLKERQWHIDRFGIVRETDPVPDDVVPEWVQPTGAQDAYPEFDVFGEPARVMHNGQEWTNTHGAANTWAPGASGWTLASAPESEPETGYPAWETWTGINADLYQIGDRVTHNGQDWEATAGNNHWEPGVFGWVVI